MAGNNGSLHQKTKRGSQDICLVSTGCLRYGCPSARRTHFQHLYSRWVYEDGQIWRKWRDQNMGDPVVRRQGHQFQTKIWCFATWQDAFGPDEWHASLLQTIPQLDTMDRCLVLPLYLGSIAYHCTSTVQPNMLGFGRWQWHSTRISTRRAIFRTWEWRAEALKDQRL